MIKIKKEMETVGNMGVGGENKHQEAVGTWARGRWVLVRPH